MDERSGEPPVRIHPVRSSDAITTQKLSNFRDQISHKLGPSSSST
jgi:hypothetical protein